MTKKITRSRAIFLMLMLVVVLGTIFMILNGNRYVAYDYVIMLTFAVNILFFVYMLMISIYEHPFSLNMMFWLFNFVFMGIAPLLQYMTDIYVWGLDPLEEEVFKTNILILIWALAYMAGRTIRFTKKSLDPTPDVVKTTSSESRKIRTKWLNLCIIGSVGIAGYYLIKVGLSNLIYRQTSGVSGLSQMETLITTHGFKNFLLFTAFFAIMEAKNNKKISVKTVVAIACLLLGCFPTGLSRNMMASFYVGLIIILIDKTRRGRWFSVVVFAGLILIFPAMNVFRYVGSSDRDLWSAMVSAVQDTYLEGHYDAHQMFISVQRYVDFFGFDYFYQIMGALLFFVPRSIWPSKPVGTGHTVITELNQYYFTNVSAPLVSELYLACGVVGIVVGGILLAKVLKKFDRMYWQEKNALTCIRTVYPPVVFMFFFMLRGDMLSSWAYTFAQIAVGMAMSAVLLEKADESKAIVKS